MKVPLRYLWLMTIFVTIALPLLAIGWLGTRLARHVEKMLDRWNIR